MSLSLEERINPLKHAIDWDIDAAMSDMKDEYTDDTETASKVWHSKNPNDPVVRR